jgi:hypothetical protein
MVLGSSPFVQPNRKIILKGKYLKPVTDFVNTLSFDDPFKWLMDLAESPMIKMVADMHREHLSIGDALDMVTAECLDFFYEHKAEKGLLSDLNNESRCELLVSRLKRYIESLPRKYIICVEIPKFPTSWPGRIRLSDDIHLVVGTVMPMALPNGPEEGIGRLVSERISFLEVRVTGYASDRVDSPGVADALAKLKIIAFNLISSGAFFRTSRTTEFSASLTTAATGEIVKIQMPHATKLCLGNIAPNGVNLLKGMMPVEQGGDSDLTGRERERVQESRGQNEALGRNLDPVVQFFAASIEPDFVSICAAIEWYQDSLSAENQTFAYLAACIGLEAILGSDQSIVGLSNRLADRYAFLLGRGRSDRERLIEQYLKVLNVRGRLVHAKAPRLTPDESEQLNLARGMLKLVIKHEIDKMLTRTRQSA